MSTDAPETIVVRIAVVVDDKGRYNACGLSGVEELARWARDGLDRRGGGGVDLDVPSIDAETKRPRARLAIILPVDAGLAPADEQTRR